MNDLEDIKNLYQSIDDKSSKMEFLKRELGELAQELKRQDEEKKLYERQIKEINKRMKGLEESIRKIWMPHIAGAEHATLDCGGIILETEPKLNVGVEEREKAIEWLADNGYKDVMKWDLHTQTLYKIAREHYEKAEQIPGLEYNYFQLIKVK